MTSPAFLSQNENQRGNPPTPPILKSQSAACSPIVEGPEPKMFRWPIRAGVFLERPGVLVGAKVFVIWMARSGRSKVNPLVSTSFRRSSSVPKASRSDWREPIVSWCRCNSARRLCKRLCVGELVVGSSCGGLESGEESRLETPVVDREARAPSTRDSELSHVPSASEVCPNLDFKSTRVQCE